MLISLNQRKKIHVFLFVLLLSIQIIFIVFWFQQKSSHDDYSASSQKAVQPSQVLNYANYAIKYYFETENNFSEYLEKGENKKLLDYQKSVQKMTAYMDTLSQLHKTVLKSSDLSETLKSKQKLEKEIIASHKKLDSLLSSKDFMLFENKGIDLKLKKYDYNKILSSITIDTIKKSTEAKKKGLFGRIGSALAGKKEVDREQIQTKIKMVFNNVERSGSLEDQLKNIFNFSEKYYSNAFERIKTNYANLNYKKRHLISINSKILASSEDLLLFYITQNQYSALLKYQNTTQLYNTNLKTTKFATISILICLLLGTVILFWYALYNYKKETELEIANSTSQKNIASLNRLIGMLGHEIKAPLSAISYQTSELKEKNNNPNLDKTINSLNFTSNSMQITVDQILNYYKNKNNAITIQNSKINLDKEITELLDPLRVLANVKKIDVVCNTLDKNNALAWVRADKGKIQQLFYNIIGNAIKFSNQGTITITRQLTPLDNNHVKFDVTIKDTGCGIPKEELELIFNEFYQSNHHHDKMKFGAGLGLSLCKELVELYNGKISVTSQVGKGTEISFYLILEQSDSSEETNKSKIITKFKDRTIHVAVIDDDKIILKTIGNLLEKINFNYTLFENVALLKNHLTTQPVDLIISDINIGNHSGLQLANEIKQLKTKKIPIIAITADPFMEISNGENTNFDAIMIKPIEKEEFYHKIEHLLN